MDLNSLGRRFLTKPYGGALTYIGAAEYSYPGIELKLLLEETKASADSSLFSFGEIYKKAAETVLKESYSLNVSRWVVFSRNFMGDPLLPVRYKNLSGSDAFKIICSDTIYSMENTITVTVTDSSDVPVEGVRVGLVSQKVEFSYPYFDPDTIALETPVPYRDYAFAHGITNRYGEVTLSFNARYEDYVSITAVHHDFISTRSNIAVIDRPQCNKIWIDETRIFEYGCNFDDSSFAEEILEDNIYQPGENLMLIAKVKNICTDTVEDVCLYLEKADTTDTDSIYIGDIGGINDSGITIAPNKIKNVYFYFSVDSCPVGANNLVMLLTNSEDNDLVYINIPVTGPKVVPVINYLVDDSNDVIPEGGDNVRMKILFGNKYPAAAYKVQGKLIEIDTTLVTVITDTTDTVKIVSKISSALDSNITYTIDNNYDEDTNGVIFAKLVITGTNIKTDTIDIDLNPLPDISFDIDPSSVAIDYQDGVYLKWDPVKYDDVFGKRSDFLGYVVMRSSTTEPSYLLLTPNAISSANYYHDQLITDDTSTTYTYRVSVVDSSNNSSKESEITVERPWNERLKEGFPIYVGSYELTPPVIADFDKNGKSEIYSISPADFSDSHGGRAVGFRSDGQEAVVDKQNDGLVTDQHTSNVVFADLDEDGFDDAIYTAGDDIIAYDLKDTTTLWTVEVDSGHSYGLEWYCRPTVADITNDGHLEVILYGLDNKHSGGQDPSGASLYVLDRNGSLLARHNFSNYSGYQHDIVVGNFDTSNDSLEIILAMKKKLYLFKHLDPVEKEFEKVNITVDDDYNVFSSISIGNCYGGEDTLLHVALMVSDKTSGPTKGILKVVEVDRTDGTFTGEIKTGNVSFSHWVLWAGAPAMANLDGDSQKEIVFAGDDTIYVFNVTSSDTLQLTDTIPYGSVPSQRLHPYGRFGRVIVADIDNDTTLEIMTTHEGDGNIWAFELDGSKCKGFPLKAKGEIDNACNVTDLEGDGTLDLTAIDLAGYIYAWDLAPGSAYKQPWPSEFNNAWHTGFDGYKPSTTNGYLLEMWDAEKKLPYAWIESDTGNATDTVTYGAFERDEDSLLLKTDDADDRNYHFMGPNMAGIKNYTIKGKLKFDSSNAEFGINFYSQWQDSAKKYSFIRESDGFGRLYYYSSSSNRTLLDVIDTSFNNDLMTAINDWYSYEIMVENLVGATGIQVRVWHDTLSRPDSAGIFTTDVPAHLTSGLIGVVSHDGSGYRCWSPISVTSNITLTGANMAYETFIQDTIVDVKPYVPQNWHPYYLYNQFITDIDTTGFVLDTSGDSASLIYRHKSGITYPTICRIIPQTSLRWRDYEYYGTIIKPEGDAYDSLEVGAIFYMQGKDDYYKLVARGKGNGGNGFVIMKGDSVLDNIGTIEFEGDTDVVHFGIKAETDDYIDVDTIIVDSIVSISAKVWVPEDSSAVWSYPPYKDEASNRKVEGYCGIIINDINIGSYLKGIETKDITIKKIVE